MKYSLGNGWPGNYFQIDPLTGVIRTNDVIIATSQTLNFDGDVITEDQGVNNHEVIKTVHITITDVNNHAPMFESDQITLMVPNVTTPGTILHKFNVTDEDFSVNGFPLMFYIPQYYLDEINNFRVDPDEGTLMLISPWTEVRSYTFQVDISNSAFVPMCVQYMQASSISVTVQITPINTACSAFSQTQYSTSIAEGELDQTKILIQIRASDSDGDSLILHY